jgi:hypothetical protein
MFLRNPGAEVLRAGVLHSWAFRLIPPTTIVRPSIAIAVIVPSIAIAVIVPSIAIAVIGPSIAVVATAIVIDVFNGCVALRKRCQTSNTGRHRRFCLPDE